MLSKLLTTIGTIYLGGTIISFLYLHRQPSSESYNNLRNAVIGDTAGTAVDITMIGYEIRDSLCWPSYAFNRFNNFQSIRSSVITEAMITECRTRGLIN